MSTTELVVDSEDIEFCLFEWLQIDQLQQFPKYEDFDTETLRLLVQEGMKFAQEVIAPTNREADREGCSVVDGSARVPDCLHSAYQQAYQLGWASVTASQEFCGQGAPEAIGLTQGAMELIESFGDDELKSTYCEKMTTGEYTGTMCLSEPQAGSDVGAAKTAAEPVEGKKYTIKGSKCWISSGDNDLGSNVIHLVLARVQGDPAGTRGLSLFVVPKINVNEDGSLGGPNDVTLVSIEDKMGIKASATAVLSFGDKDNCYGHMLGERGDGMSMMFQMMNTECIMVAGMGLGIASAAYQNALAYAKERIQGAHIDSQDKGPDAPSVAIIEHPDVRYSLTSMKARVEAIRALLYGACFIEDKLHITEDAEERGLSGAVLYATPFMFLLSTVTAAYFFLQQGLVAHDSLEAIKGKNPVNEEGLADFLQGNARARFYDNKLKTLDFFLNVTLPRYQSYAVPILNRNYTALDIAL